MARSPKLKSSRLVETDDVDFDVDCDGECSGDGDCNVDDDVDSDDNTDDFIFPEKSHQGNWSGPAATENIGELYHESVGKSQ